MNKPERQTTIGRKNLDGTTTVTAQGKIRAKDDVVKYIKCTNCGIAITYQRFIVLDGGNVKFCRCKCGDENIVITYQ